MNTQPPSDPLIMRCMRVMRSMRAYYDSCPPVL
jgi:hypothetical protein